MSDSTLAWPVRARRWVGVQISALRSRRGGLWVALLLLVALLLGVLVFLASQFEEARDRAALERDATALASDIRAQLMRNVQTLQALHSSVPLAEDWEAPAGELLVAHRELVRLAWRATATACWPSAIRPTSPAPTTPAHASSGRCLRCARPATTRAASPAPRSPAAMSGPAMRAAAPR